MYISSAVGSVLIAVLILSIVTVTVFVIKKQRLQANSCHTVIPLYAEISEPLYETILACAETECTTEGLGMMRGDTSDQTVVVTGDNDNQDFPDVVSHRGLIDHHYEQVTIFDVSHSGSSVSCRSVDLAEIHELDVITSAYERVQYNEKTLQLLRRMPHVATCTGTVQNSVYERVQYSEEVMRLLRRMPHVATCTGTVQNNAYERVQYSEEVMRLLRRMPHVATCTDTVQNSAYERVQYSEEVMRLLRRMPHVATCTDAVQNNAYERVQYSEAAMRLLRRMPHVADTVDNIGYERVQYSDEAVPLPPS